MLALAAVGVAGGGETAAAALRYERAAVDAGEWWRLVTGHFVHLGPGHLALNLAGLALIGWLTGREYDPAEWWAVTAGAAAVISAALYLLHPTVAWYVGLSGVLHGLLLAGLLPALGRRDPLAAAVALLLVGKLAWESVAGPLPGSEQTAGGPVLVESHRYGALGGVAVALVFMGRRRWRATQTL